MPNSDVNSILRQNTTQGTPSSPQSSQTPSFLDDPNGLPTHLGDVQQALLGGNSSQPLAGQTYQGGGATPTGGSGAPPDLGAQNTQGSQTGQNTQGTQSGGLSNPFGDPYAIYQPQSGTSVIGSDPTNVGSSSSSGTAGGSNRLGALAALHAGGAAGPTSTAGVDDDFSGLSIQAIVLKVLNEAYESANKDALDYAKKTQFYTNVKAALRNEQDSVRTALAGAADVTSNTLQSAFTAHQPPIIDYTGQQTVQYRSDSSFYADQGLDGSAPDSSNATHSAFQAGGKITTKSALSAYADKLQNDLDTVGDDSSKAQTQLQQTTSQQQQLLTQITQLIKNYNDTSLSIIRNI